MYELRVAVYTCRGLKSCGRCEEHLPGFLSEHCGELMISQTHLSKNIKAITAALEDCPNESLTLELDS